MTERKRYSKPPVVEVFCKIDFPPILKINDIPSAFQEKIRDEYPEYIQEMGQEIQISSNIGGPPQFSSVMTSKLNAHVFRTFDESCIMKITPTNFFFSTTKYTEWEEFREKFLKAYRFFEEIYSPQVFSRVGLMYRDIFIRSNYGLEDKEWPELIRPEYLGMLPRDEIDGTSYNGFSDLKFKESEERMKLSVVTVVNEKDNLPFEDKERCLLLDTDFYLMGRILPKEKETVLENLHKRASNIFRSMTQKILSDAME
jgi:uncharacterized protein (TIGR04255 family)